MWYDKLTIPEKTEEAPEDSGSFQEKRRKSGRNYRNFLILWTEANNYDEEVANKAEKKLRKEQEKAAKIKQLEEKRAKKLAEIERRKELTE